MSHLWLEEDALVLLCLDVQLTHVRYTQQAQLVQNTAA
jgi:hypothetical protein